MSTVQIEYRLNILPGDHGGRILIPGCEPASTLTSTRMMSEMREAGLCTCAIANVDDVLEAIPGSRIEYLLNSELSGKILVLPAWDQTCPCTGKQDYYQILRDLCQEVDEEELQELVGCDSFPATICSSRREWRGQ